MRKLNPQWWLIPENKGALIMPFFALVAEFHVEMPQHTRKDRANSKVSETAQVH
jgi:hypothetical protein